jgi:hypothetical protein
MASGDTIPGSIRVQRVDTEGNNVNIFNSFDQSRVDGTKTTDASDLLYLNTKYSDRYSKPSGAESRSNADAEFAAGEELLILHRSAGSTASIDVDEASAFTVNVVQEDLNRGRFFTPTLTAPDNEVTSNPSADPDEFVQVYKFTVPDRQRLLLAGSFEATATEV